MVLVTRVATAKAGTKSMKSTVPEGIVEFLQLEDKDEIEWKMHVEDNVRTAMIRKRDYDSVEQAKHIMKIKRDRDSEEF